MASKIADKDIYVPHAAGYGRVKVARKGDALTPAKLEVIKRAQENEPRGGSRAPGRAKQGGGSQPKG